MFPILDSIPAWVKRDERQYLQGALILEPYGENKHLYILAAGTATVYSYGLNGEVLNIYNYTPTDYFGEVELLCGQRYPLMIQAQTDCTVLCIPQKDFIRWLGEDSAFSLYIMRRLCEKLLASSEKMVRFSMMDMRQRYLLCVYGRWKAHRLGGLTKAMVAEEICAPVRSLNRIIAQNISLVAWQGNSFKVVHGDTLTSECEKIQALLWQHR